MHYTKMHGAGNSFLVIEDAHGRLTGEDLSVLARRLCSGEDGPGADGLMALVPAEGADFGMRFYNADGSLGEMCGNGARCAARYGLEHGLAADAEDVRILATAGLVHGRRITEELYRVRLNDPSVVDLRREVAVGGERTVCAYVELGKPGIPHAVAEVEPCAFDDMDALRKRGRALRYSAAFPRGANVTFVCLTGPDSVRAVTYERGVEDFTLACGTGCGATATALILSGRVAGEALDLHMPGGELRVTLTKQGDTVRDIFLTGPTAVVEEGDFAL